MTNADWALDRQSLANRFLSGIGLEFGALHNPVQVSSKRCRVVYVDRLSKTDLLEKYPELAPHAEAVVEPDILMDVERDSLWPLSDYQFDFFIANHMIEHLINPIRWLKEMGDVMKPGAVLYLAVPDKDYTFDKNRALTDFDHLWQEYQDGTIELSTNHLNDFILNITKDHIEPDRKALMYFEDDRLPAAMAERERVYKLHRDRSIHVHVWNKPTFADFLDRALGHLNSPLQVVSSSGLDNDSFESIHILQAQ